MAQLKYELCVLGATELHHGDCVGSDKAAHEVARQLNLRIVIHPPVNGALRAYCVGDELRPEYDYLDRNRHIVEDTDWLIALPDGPERARSGTWSTVRYADRLAKPKSVFLPEVDAL
jgi:hypothetical protein